MQSLKEKLPQMMEWMGVDPHSVTNIFNFGSWVHKTNSEHSDRDVLIVADFEQSHRHFKFIGDTPLPYFHRYKMWNFPRDIPAEFKSDDCPKTDITIYSFATFEKLLEANYMIVVECLFFPQEFQIQNQRDWKELYLTRYYNPDRIKHALQCEQGYSHRSLKNCIDNQDYLKEHKYRTVKRLFHMLQYFENGLQLLKFKHIEFGRSVPTWLTIKEAYDNGRELIDIYTSIIEPIEKKFMEELKSI